MAKRLREKAAARKENADKRPHAVAKYIRISPDKVRIVLDIVRGRTYNEAVAILKNTPKAASEPVLKVLESAAANAENNLNMSFFLPQPLTKLEFDGSNYTGSYIEVDCEIFDVASGARIWPTASTPPSQLVDESPAGRLIFPMTSSAVSDWKIGHAYIYNIKIDNTTVIQPIDFNLTVDDFSLEN